MVKEEIRETKQYLKLNENENKLSKFVEYSEKQHLEGNLQHRMNVLEQKYKISYLSFNLKNNKT